VRIRKYGNVQQTGQADRYIVTYMARQSMQQVGQPEAEQQRGVGFHRSPVKGKTRSEFERKNIPKFLVLRLPPFLEGDSELAVRLAVF
jgi:hypothetical protein